MICLTILCLNEISLVKKGKKDLRSGQIYFEKAACNVDSSVVIIIIISSLPVTCLVHIDFILDQKDRSLV